MDDRAPPLDLLIIGAGISGLALASFHLHIHPNSNVLLLDRDTHPGGVWNSRRAYPGFWTQWTVGTAEFSDMPMEIPREEDQYLSFFKADHTTRYLERYVDERGLRKRIKFGIEVEKVERANGQHTSWAIEGVEMGGERDKRKLRWRTKKLVVASGLTSIPNVPELPAKETFGAPILHQESFGQSSVLDDAAVRNVTVVGGGKSAADMVYACVKAGKTVDWVIRRSGTGPGFFVSPKGKGPYKNAFEIGSTRIASTISPSIYNADNWWTRFLHGSERGRGIVAGIWNQVHNEIITEADFERKDAKAGFGLLKPKSPIFWQNGTGGLLNHADFWETIAPNVQIHECDIRGLSSKTVHLEDGDSISSDILLCGTGWKWAFPFLSAELATELGLPHPLDNPADDKHWADLEQQADTDILIKFPSLATPPEHPHRSRQTTPFRLYKGIAPLSDASEPSIVFVGFTVVANYIKGAECQAIWANAYLDNHLSPSLPALAEREEEVARTVAFCKRRYLSSGEAGNFLPFESNGYCDHLLDGCGLNSHYVKGLFAGFRNLFVPGTAKDLRGLRGEYIAKFGGEGITPQEEGGKQL